jgi:magnesium chelatase family protein
MALGILGAMGVVEPSSDHMFVGELSLDGALRPVRGVLPIAACARERGITNLLVPFENAAEASVADGVRVFGVRHLTDAVNILKRPSESTPQTRPVEQLRSPAPTDLDFRDVHGQNTAKRALEVAAAGGHSVLLLGPPGSGKTMLARRFPGILPPLTFNEALETTKIHSVAGILPQGAGLIQDRPFRAPHHSVSDAGLLGGGSGMPRPGEVSLAHNGVLFLDELPEFPRNVLEQLRQPLEEGSVTLARAQMTLQFPARFMLLGAMNPCPCGHFGDPTRECRCTGAIIQRYLAKISGPLLDRIDLHIEVPAVPYQELRGASNGATSAEISERVCAARAIQSARGFYNSHIPARLLRELCALDPAGERTLEMAVRRMGLSARSHDRILKVARTVADLDRSIAVTTKHLAEAVQYRSLDRNYWH